MSRLNEYLFSLRDEGMESVENASIPAFGDVAGEAEGGAAPGPRWWETAFGRSEEHASASKTKMEADLSATEPFLWPPSTQPSIIPAGILGEGGAGVGVGVDSIRIQERGEGGNGLPEDEA